MNENVKKAVMIMIVVAFIAIDVLYVMDIHRSLVFNPYEDIGDMEKIDIKEDIDSPVIYDEFNPDLVSANPDLKIPELPSRALSKDAIVYSLGIHKENISDISNNEISIGDLADACCYYVLIGNYMYKEDDFFKEAVKEKSTKHINDLKNIRQSNLTTEEFKSLSATREDAIYLIYEILYENNTKNNEIINNSQLIETFKDANYINDWAQEAIKVLYRKGYFYGAVDPDGNKVIKSNEPAKIKFAISLMERFSPENFQDKKIIFSVILKRTATPINILLAIIQILAAIATICTFIMKQ